jgi:hypothetical protein
MKRLFWPSPNLGQATTPGCPGATEYRRPERPRPRPRPRWRLAALASLTVASTALIGAADSSAAGHTSARVARTLNGTATAHLHLVKANGSQLDEEGPVAGALSGSMRAVLTTGNVFSGSFTINTNGGAIDGHGRATTHGSGRYQNFNGSITVTGGTGRYTHAHGRTGLSGTFDRRTYAVVIKTTGTLAY